MTVSTLPRLTLVEAGPILPGYSWGPDTSRYRNGETGRFVARKDILGLLSASTNANEESMRAGVLAYHSGELDQATFLARTTTMLRREYLQNTALGSGGWERMGPVEWGRIGGRLRSEYAYLRGFAQEIADGTVSAAQAAARMQSYVGGARHEFFRAERENEVPAEAGKVALERRVLSPEAKHCRQCPEYAALGWQPAGELPLPTEECDCRNNCLCSIATKEVPADAADEVVGTGGGRAVVEFDPDQPRDEGGKWTDGGGGGGEEAEEPWERAERVRNEQRVALGDWGLKPGTYTAWRGGTLAPKTKRGLFLSPDRFSANMYAKVYSEGNTLYKVEVDIKNPLVSERVDRAYMLLKNPGYVPSEREWDTASRGWSSFARQYQKARDRMSDEGGAPRLDTEVAAMARKQGYDAIVYTRPLLPAVRELVLLNGEPRVLETLVAEFDPDQPRDEGGKWTDGGGGGGGGQMRLGPDDVHLKYKIGSTASGKQRVDDATSYVRGYAERRYESDAPAKIQEGVENLRRFCQTYPVVTRRGFGSSLKILEEGRFKTQFETGRSSGAYDPAHRRDVEQTVLGVPQDTPDEERLIYGFLDDKENRAGEYGPVKWVLNDDVKTRSTVTVGDSFQSESVGVGTPLLDPTEAGWDSKTGNVVGDTIAVACYVEVQIQGGLRLEDIDHIELMTNTAAHSTGKAFRVAAEAAGVEVVIINKYGEPVEEAAVSDGSAISHVLTLPRAILWDGDSLYLRTDGGRAPAKGVMGGMFTADGTLVGAILPSLAFFKWGIEWEDLPGD